MTKRNVIIISAPKWQNFIVKFPSTVNLMLIVYFLNMPNAKALFLYCDVNKHVQAGLKPNYLRFLEIQTENKLDLCSNHMLVKNP